MITDKQNRLDCQDSAWARKTFRTLQVLRWGSLPLQGTYVPSLPHTPEKQQLSTSTASRHFQSQWSDSATRSLLCLHIPQMRAQIQSCRVPNKCRGYVLPTHWVLRVMTRYVTMENIYVTWLAISVAQTCEKPF